MVKEASASRGRSDYREGEMMSSEDLWQEALSRRIEAANKKVVFTPGPASLCSGNLEKLGPAFGRGDDEYETLENTVLESLRRMTGHQRIARLQGSATLALEIAAQNFVYGRVLVVSTGYYSDRLATLMRMVDHVVEVELIKHDQIHQVSGSFDWVVSCYVETSCALKLQMKTLRSLVDRVSAKLYVDATASIGLEDNHEFADVVAYSSCKGLCGLTGGSFIAFNGEANNEVNSFYLDLKTHLEKRVTGPYHVMQSLSPILEDYSSIRYAISENKAAFMRRFEEYLSVLPDMQPQLCTHVTQKLEFAGNALMYQPRAAIKGSIVCHLGEAHLGVEAQGNLVEMLRLP